MKILFVRQKNFINETDFDSIYYKTNHIFYWNLKSKEKIKDEFKDSDRLSLHGTI